MTTSPIIETASTVPDEIIFPEGDLWSDEPPLESNLHLRQIILLIQSLEWLWQDRDDFFAAGNLTIYYNPEQRKSEDFRGPDFFVVLGTERRLERKSWVVWQEGGKYPDLIVEILSSSTAKIDRGEKKQIYQDIFRTPDYFWFDPETLELQGFRLVEGEYQAIEPTEQGWLWSGRLELYLGVYEKQLRYFTAQEELVPLPEEVTKQAERKVQQAEQQVEQERLGKELAQQQTERLKAQLRALGVEPK